MLFPVELTHDGGLPRHCLPADTLGRNVPIADSLEVPVSRCSIHRSFSRLTIGFWTGSGKTTSSQGAAFLAAAPPARSPRHDDQRLPKSFLHRITVPPGSPQDFGKLIA
jgi:hypothetical protein